MKKLLLISLLGMLLTLCFANQADKSYARLYLESYPQTVFKGLSAPRQWHAKDWILAGGCVLGTIAIYSVDEELRDLAQNNRSDFSNSLMTGAKQFGEGIFVIPAIGATILGGYALNSPRTMDTGLLSLKSLFLAQGITQSVKLLTQRNRPSADKGKQLFNWESFERKQDSFPSGHTTIVWSIAPIIAAQYKAAWVAPTVYSIATLTSLSRVHDNNHWASDVFAGAIVGYFTAKLVLDSSPSLQLVPNRDLSGLGVQYHF